MVCSSTDGVDGEVQVDRGLCSRLPINTSLRSSSPFLAPSFLKADPPCKIEDRLFLGSMGSASDRAALQSLGVSHVLTVAGGLGPCPFPDSFAYCVVDVDDRMSVDLAAHFSRCFAFIEEGRRAGGVLVHCLVGISRSVTVITAYLMKVNGWELRHALYNVKAKRPIAQPNLGFMRQLQEYENQLAFEEEDYLQSRKARQADCLDSWF